MKPKRQQGTMKMEANIIIAGVAAGLPDGVILHALHQRLLKTRLIVAQGNLCRAARAAGVHRNTYTRQCALHGVNATLYRPPQKAGVAQPRKKRV